uniref:Uncharacterized protein n=1 Tax=Arundo donax TaxID=35708 RepID=A0A0A9CQV8_ARUDO
MDATSSCASCTRRSHARTGSDAGAGSCPSTSARSRTRASTASARSLTSLSVSASGCHHLPKNNTTSAPPRASEANTAASCSSISGDLQWNQIKIVRRRASIFRALSSGAAAELWRQRWRARGAVRRRDAAGFNRREE